MEETQYASVDDLIAGDLDDGAQDVTLPSGKKVRVRGLSRYELMLHGKDTDDSRIIEIRNVRACLVQPPMTEKQIEQWQKNSKAGGDFKVMSEWIRDLSGLSEGAQKSDVAEVRD